MVWNLKNAVHGLEIVVHGLEICAPGNFRNFPLISRYYPPILMGILFNRCCIKRHFIYDGLWFTLLQTFTMQTFTIIINKKKEF